MRVMIELRHSQALRGAAPLAFSASAPGLQTVAGVSLDANYAPVRLPGARPVHGGVFRSLAQPLTFLHDPGDSTYVVRGVLPSGPAQQAAWAGLMAHPDVVGVYSDPRVRTTQVCGGSAPIADADEVAKRLDVAGYHARGFDGSGVPLAIVDTGINAAHLKAQGRSPVTSAVDSWNPPGVVTKPFEHVTGHGTISAFDAGIAAPHAMLLDYALLLSTTPGVTALEGFLSDALSAYGKLLDLIRSQPADARRLVVCNSWALYDLNSDYAPGHPGNYSDNPSHAFNVMVASLEHEGADIVFSAGNCGAECPSSRFACNFGTDPVICGANSHPKVLCVSAVDLTLARAAYSSRGPGRLEAQKPDVAGFAHFAGSGVSPADEGTSAAGAVVAGLIAGVRAQRSAADLSPQQLRALICRCAQDLGATGHDPEFGWGAVDGKALLARL